jgi:hypothetical protein
MIEAMVEKGEETSPDGFEGLDALDGLDPEGPDDFAPAVGGTGRGSESPVDARQAGDDGVDGLGKVTAQMAGG